MNPNTMFYKWTHIILCINLPLFCFQVKLHCTNTTFPFTCSGISGSLRGSLTIMSGALTTHQCGSQCFFSPGVIHSCFLPNKQELILRALKTRDQSLSLTIFTHHWGNHPRSLFWPVPYFLEAVRPSTRIPAYFRMPWNHLLCVNIFIFVINS